MNNNNFILKIINNLNPIIEELIISICKDLNKEDHIENILNKYIKNQKMNILKKIKIKEERNKRRKTAYSMFLKHNDIRKKNKKLTLDEYNKIKGEYWKNITKEEREKYENMANEWNDNNMPKKKEKKEKKEKEEKEDNKKDNKKELIDYFFDDEYIKNEKIEEI